MNRIVALVRWFCRQLSLEELFTATAIILEVLNNERPDIKPKDSFRQEHPNYCKFDVDPELPLTECPVPLDDLKNIQTIQGRWGKILDMATQLAA